MVRRFATHLLLFCYGVAALWGQGLHEFLDDDGCEGSEQTVAAVVVVGQIAGTAGVIHSPSGGHVHDCDNCPICQFQALGQHFVAPPPTEIGMAVCDVLLPEHAECVHCPALFSPAQPRAPPVA